MASIVQYLLRKKEKLISPPPFIKTNLMYECIMGSTAYGCAENQASADWDIYGFAIPPKHIIFPHTVGLIKGFGNQGEAFDQWQQHHIYDNNKKRSFDFQIFNIVKFFQLAYESNPNIVDSLFVSETCVLHSTAIGNRIREQRKLFLSKRIWKKFRGYAYSQLHKMDSKEATGNRLASIEKYGYDVKYAYHVVRLLNEAEQILMTGDLDLQQNREQLKSIRRGEWTQEQIRQHFDSKAAGLEEVFLKSDLQEVPPEGKVKALLLECLEEHYGSLKKLISVPKEVETALREVDAAIAKVRHLL